MPNHWKTLSSTYVHENPWYKVRQDKVITPSGKDGTYTVIEKPPSVFVIAITEEHTLLFVRLFRYPTQIEDWEVPAGIVEDGEEPLQAAKRELQEETGMRARGWRLLGSHQEVPGVGNIQSYVFLAKGLSPVQGNEQAEEGIAEVKAFGLPQIARMIVSGNFVDGPSLSALTYLLVADQESARLVFEGW